MTALSHFFFVKMATIKTPQIANDDLTQIYNRIAEIYIGHTVTVDLVRRKIIIEGIADLGRAFTAATFAYRAKIERYRLDVDVTQKKYQLHIYL